MDEWDLLGIIEQRSLVRSLRAEQKKLSLCPQCFQACVVNTLRSYETPPPPYWQVC